MKKLTLIILFIVFAMMTIINAQEFTTSINVAGGASEYELTFGFNPSATDGYDDDYDWYAPPAPPPPAFDAALGWDGDRYYTQILAGDGDLSQHQYDISLQYGSDNNIDLVWDNTGWSDMMSSCVLQDAFGGMMINVDMLSEASLTLTNPAFTTLNLLVTPLPPPSVPTVTITSPEDGATIGTGDFSIEYSTTDFTIGEAGCSDCDGHVHVFVDGSANAYGDYMVYAEGPVSLTGVPNGEHSIMVQLVDPSHQAFDPSVESTVNVTVSIDVDDPPMVGDIPDQSVASGENFDSFDLDDYLTELDGDDVAWSYEILGGEDPESGFSAMITATGLTGEEQASYDLTFGFHPDATDGYDADYDMYAPPAPPPPAFDAALVWDGDRYYTQILAYSPWDSSEHEYDISLAYGSDNMIDLTWDNTGWSDMMSSCVLQDAFGGMMINVDMLSEASLTLTNPAFTTLNLLVTPLPEAVQTRGIMVDIDGDNIATVTYTDGFMGSETVTFTATDQTADMLSDSDDATFTVTEFQNTPPVAGFTWSAEDLTVTFTNTSTDADGDTLTYSWDFGEDTTSTSTETNPTHTYASAGTYEVSLTASDGTDENTYSEEITVSLPPEISVTPSSLSLELNEGETGTQTLTISNTGEGPLEVTLSIDDGTVTDIDGNVYETVEIGERVWMKENLKVVHYNDGSEIPTGYSNSEWTSLSTGAYAVYDDNPANADTYGYLYNWYAVEDDRGVCPEGWNVPTDDEYTELTDYLGGLSVAGGKMKECTEGNCPDSEYWDSPNTGATNESGFTGLPGGDRYYYYGSYDGMGGYGYFWSSTESGSSSALTRKLGFSDSGIHRYSNLKRSGFSVRCIRDVDYLTIYPDGVGIENVRDEWLTLSDHTLTIPSGSSEDIIVTFNAESLEIGEYDADIIISSNDPDNSPLNVPVSLTVNEEDGEPLVIESETILSLIGRSFVDNQLVAMDTLGNGDILLDIAHSDGPALDWDLNELMFFPGQVETLQYLEFTEDIPQFENDSLAMCNFVERRYGSSEDPDSTWDNYIYSYVSTDTLYTLGEYNAVVDSLQQQLTVPMPLPIQYGDSASMSLDFLGMEMNLTYSVDRWGDLIYENESLPVLGQTSIFWMAPPDSMPDTAIGSLRFLDEDFLTAVQMMAVIIPSEEEEPSEITEIFMVLHDYDEMYFGCIDSTASNYDFTATIDDGSCEYVEMAVVDSTTGAITDTLVVSSGSGDVELTIDAGTVLILDGDTVMVNLDIVVSDFSADSITATIDDSTELASDIVAFEPFGLTFSAPVEISIAYNSSRSDFRLMMLDNELDDTWEEVDADCSDGNCNAGVLSFGLFSVQDMDPPLSIITNNSVPETFVLKQNFPNPFNPITTLQYGLPQQSFVTLTIYNMLGIKIKQLVNRTQQAGFNSVQWDATDSMGRPVSAGVYLYQIQAGEFVQTKKMVLLK